jgi:chorismate synthase
LLEIAKCLKLNVSHLFSDPWIAEDNHTPVLSITSPEEQEFNESNSFAELEIRLEVARADVESIGKRIALLRQDIAAAQGDPWADALRERLRDLMLAICDIAFAADEQASAEQVNDN